ncbi:MULTISPECIES: DUF6795 domain-containing protein [unclassified Pseudoalteromonas]|uniref:DUF6795 domain-containing protein n=1 Tax=unclassified Pseudoalteromonas TaxID=194690 RepID=UPI0015F82658|nr:MULTISPECIES: DUF6795 domain-containing protein [unclassified Pseudoalteromonas]MBB1384089.1 hypothetical protein [Pseudoalteromonas sp. SG45-5]MBB1392201.1 hypothetical protein [Pseudoalteromonas sp. SG44-4]MBB1448053.1 hypothetical protein [Pseudoalteromonas sp. SG41-6]
MLSRLKAYFLVIVSIIIIFTTTQACADMFGFFNKQDFILSAPVKGQLLDDGQPVANTKVTRTLIYGDEYIDEATTDSDGHFSFPKKAIKTSKPSNMFDNESLIQHIYLENGTPEGIVLWYVTVSLHEESGTLTELLTSLVCDISKEPQTYDLPIKEAPEHVFTIYTTCKI